MGGKATDRPHTNCSKKAPFFSLLPILKRRETTTKKEAKKKSWGCRVTVVHHRHIKRTKNHEYTKHVPCEKSWLKT
jgi:hypothetical protein